MEWAQKVIDGAGDTALWLRGVILGEWEDHRSISQMVTDALAGFVPGVGSIITLRDLLAVIVRLAKYPEKRQEVEEWILLIAMLLPLIVTALGALVAGIGALAGAELGAFLRALTLMLVKEGGVALKILVEFFQHHGYGDVVAALKKVKFASYKKQLVDSLLQQIDRLVKLIEALKTRLASLAQLPAWIPGHQALNQALHNADVWIARLKELKRAAHDMIPQSLIELDRRLAALLAGDIKAATQATHQVTAGVPAPKPPIPEPVKGADGKPTGVGKAKGDPEPGNTRRVAERKFLVHEGGKFRQEFAISGENGLPVGAKPYKAGETVLENKQLQEMGWKANRAKIQEGYPDLNKVNRNNGKPTEDFKNFSDLNPVSYHPGDKLVRVIPYDDPTRAVGKWWTETLPADGEQLRARTAVKEAWNKNGAYVEMRVPPKGSPAWDEIHTIRRERAAAAGFDPDSVPREDVLKAWKGTASSQVYEHWDPVARKAVPDDYYLPGGDQQLFIDPKEQAVLEKYGRGDAWEGKHFSKPKPTNFRDYDPNVPNPDGSKGNIVPKGGPVLIAAPKDEALL